MQCTGYSSQIYPPKADIMKLHHEVGEWLVLSTAKPILFSLYNATAWSIAFLYARWYVHEHLGLDLHTMVDVQGK